MNPNSLLARVRSAFLNRLQGRGGCDLGMAQPSSQNCFAEPLEGRRMFSTYLVTSLSDSAGGSTTPTGRDSYSVPTLRAAIVAANARPGHDTIRFSNGLNGTIKLARELAELSDQLTIVGPGAARLGVGRSTNAGTDFSIFRIKAGKSVTLVGMTVTGGTGTADATDPSTRIGGGIVNRGMLSLSGCTVRDNTAQSLWGGGGGGGVYNTGSLTLTNCKVTNNATVGGQEGPDGEEPSGSDGGGIFNFHGKVLLNLCTVQGNRCSFSGGGVYSVGGELTVVGSSLIGNQAFVGGGVQSLGSLMLTNSTLSGNSAFSSGAVSNHGNAMVVNCTIVANTANMQGGGSGGVSNFATLSVHNSIVAGNVRTSGSKSLMSDLRGVPVAKDSSFNLVGADESRGLVTGTSGNRVGVSVTAISLISLATNGGPTQSYAPLPGGLAIDSGANLKASAAGLRADQRGLGRVSNGRVDIGAVEFQRSGTSIKGTYFNDANRDGARQFNESGLEGMQVYIDSNLNSTYDPGEQTTFTAALGAYVFAGLNAGTYRVRAVQQPGWVRSRPSGEYPLGFYDVTLQSSVGGAVSGRDFGSYLAQ